MFSKPEDRPMGITMDLGGTLRTSGPEVEINLPQVELKIISRFRGWSRLFRDRTKASAPTYPDLTAFLRIRVGSGSEKFGAYLYSAVEQDQALTSAKERLHTAKQAFRDLRKKAADHWNSLAGFSKVDQEVTALNAQKVRLERRRRRHPNEEVLLDIIRKQLMEKEPVRNGLMRENPLPFDTNDFDKTDHAVYRAEKDLNRIREALNSIENRADVLEEYLEERGLQDLPDEIKQAIANQHAKFYELERDAKVDDDGVPWAQRKAHNGTKELTETKRCDIELRFPWHHVHSALNGGKANLLHVASARHRVFCRVKGKEQIVPTHVVLYVPGTEGLEGWVLLLTQHQLYAIIKNYDERRSAMIPVLKDESDPSLGSKLMSWLVGTLGDLYWHESLERCFGPAEPEPEGEDRGTPLLGPGDPAVVVESPPQTPRGDATPPAD